MGHLCVQDALAPFFSQLLDLAAALLVASAAGTVSAGCALYALLMSVFKSDPNRQVRVHLHPVIVICGNPVRVRSQRSQQKVVVSRWGSVVGA